MVGTLIRRVFVVRGFEMFTAGVESFDSVDRTTGWGFVFGDQCFAYAGWGLLATDVLGDVYCGLRCGCLKNEVAVGRPFPVGRLYGASVAVLLGLAVFLVGMVLVRRISGWSGYAWRF